MYTRILSRENYFVQYKMEAWSMSTPTAQTYTELWQAYDHCNEALFVG